jgi:hypothetical protein
LDRRDGVGGRRHEELAVKLRLTAAALGCATRKDLCGLFRAVNPATGFDLERSYKWTQGRALPRSVRIYEDWAQVIATSRSPDWLMHCTVGEFLQELEAIRGVSAKELLRRARIGDDESREAGSSLGPDSYLAGSYACYSFAWSSYFRGKLIRGQLEVQPGRGGQAAPTAAYSETLPVGRCTLRGSARICGRSLFLDLRDAASGLPLFFTLYLPAPPASVLAGLMAGATMVGPDPEPSVTRIAMVRVSTACALLDDTNRYMEATEEAVMRDLADLGLPASAETGSVMLSYLSAGRRPGIDQVLREEVTPLVAALDRLYIAGRSARLVASPHLSLVGRQREPG